jgi:SAM-dependent methyltransferase
VLEVACGSAPLGSRLQGHWAGIDRSDAELALAHRRGAAPLVRADATALPVASGHRDTVVCAMGLMLFDPLPQAVSELARVTCAAGRLVALLPASGPVTWRDRLRYARLLVALRRRGFAYPHHPSRVDAVLQSNGFDVVASERRSFRYAVDDQACAHLLVDSLYLPGTSPERVERARAVTRRWVGTSIGVPLRRVVAVRRVSR